ncbi:cation diffusion facilitator family transporter [Methanimicrococcus blatticola]|uniref:Cation diffusion facilitator family transporter n=1 Tax=Methanimicrococcus blatticola TaxID=91560 RepID=A0A484F7N6_9EURY|nr:cation diffusion facilitator family transporter [Methanimicrococcus blatticola]MBZ3934863.1 cation diffusion facilitator family transporter [Methanimicrococcus blatticola]MCC2509038.1 cation diffusion facilitator family transporter [Methanimicrococcus blatticola]TDQ70936.1 cation diffusion facilitator family transporter [Methanimicrococcus blatticola]
MTGKKHETVTVGLEDLQSPFQHAEYKSKEGLRVTIIGMAVNILLTIFKVIAGVIGNSAALIADGVHSLSDLLSDFVVIFSIRISAKPEDDSHNFGHKKIESLASVVVGVMLLLAGALILSEAAGTIYDFIEGTPIEKPAMITFYVALLSIIAKELLYQYTHRVAKKLGSDMIEVNAWHHRTDAFSSVGVAAGIGAAILLGDKWAILDPIMAVLLALYILYIALKIIYNSTNDLMDASLSPEINEEIKTIILDCEGVLNMHSLKTRKLGSSKAIDMHIMIDENLTVKEAAEIQKEVENCLKQRFGADTYVIIKVEPFLDRKVDREKHILEGL